jgi:Peptidase family M49
MGKMRVPHAMLGAAILPWLLAGCAGKDDGEASMDGNVQELLNQYTTVRLTADLSTLSDADRTVIRYLLGAMDAMDDVYWEQAYGDRDALLDDLEGEAVRRLVEINYGPWDRLGGDAPFVEGVGAKPAGANLYPVDMTSEEFEAAAAAAADGGEALRSLYTLVRRADDGSLTTVPYHMAFAEQHQVAAEALRRASAAAEEPGLERYLSLRADALLTDEYQASDMAWLDMKDNTVDVVIGPIETYEDLLFGRKAAHEAYILIKDKAWSERLSRFASLLPGLQRGLPVPEAYKRETPGSDSDLNAYDAVYYAGQANAGSKTIAINLPNDEEVQLAKGTRRLQLKNTMRAKFDRILVPIAGELIAEDQRSNVTFDAFFANTMFHEVAHGLGIKNTIDGSSTVRGALLETASAMEEGKADVLGLYMVTSLLESGEITEGTLEDYYVTFIASIFRSVRFGATSAHGRANMVRFNYFQERGAFTRDDSTGTYRVDLEAMGAAINGLSELILTLQGDGDHDGAAALLAEKGVVVPALQADLDRLGSAGIPVDIIFEQGESVLFGG